MFSSTTAPRLGFALTAYAGTGKDTFVREVREGKLTIRPHQSSAERVRWVVYALKGWNFSDLERLLLDPDGAQHVTRFAFADALKEKTHAWLGFSNCPALAFEAVKDTLIAKDPAAGGMKTIRQHYIAYGQACRRDSPQIWANIVAEKIALMTDPRKIDITTDWRFDNELAVRARIPTTIRLFREEVKTAAPLGDRSNDSEHNLDNYLTDYLFVPPGQLAAALAVFPQYSDFVPLLFIVEK